MIRKFKPEDLEEVMEVWLISNLQVHDFVSKKYWQKNYGEIKRILPMATVYVWEENGQVQAFIGAMQNLIIAQFARSDFRKRYIGKILLDYLKMEEEELTISVYEKNVRAVKFYMREEFKVQSERVEESTGEKELILKWKKKVQGLD